MSGFQRRPEDYMSHSATSGTLMRYGAIILISSAVLLVLEIAAGRLIAPYVGVSLYSWTSIIGVILAGLSLGNWLGGYLADRGAGDNAAAVVLLAGGGMTLAILGLLTITAPIVMASEWGLLGASFFLVSALFFIPAALLGIVAPLLTTLALKSVDRPGHVVGTMHALGALGSIAGTFAAGFWLVQSFGTRRVIIGSAVVLFALALVLFRKRAVGTVATLLVATVIAGVTSVKQGFAEPCQIESAYYCVRVDDASRDVPFGEARVMVLDHLVHGINHATEPGMMVAPYVHLSDELVLGHLGGERASQGSYLFMGGGAYTHPRAIRALYPDAAVTVIELDPDVTRMAAARLWLNADGMRIIHSDARAALNRMPDERFDVVVGDVFQDVAMPYHLLTREYAAEIKRRLQPGGVYALNVVDIYPNPRLVQALVKTLKQEFAHVHVWLEQEPEEPTRMTYVLSATDLVEAPSTIYSQRGFERTWQRVTHTVLAQATETIPVLTDDLAPVEALTSRLLLTRLGR